MSDGPGQRRRRRFAPVAHAAVAQRRRRLRRGAGRPRRASRRRGGLGGRRQRRRFRPRPDRVQLRRQPGAAALPQRRFRSGAQRILSLDGPRGRATWPGGTGTATATPICSLRRERYRRTGGSATTLWVNDGGSFTDAAAPGCPEFATATSPGATTTTTRTSTSRSPATTGRGRSFRSGRTPSAAPTPAGRSSRSPWKRSRAFRFSAAAFADIEEDGDLDLVSAGRGAAGSPLSAINENLSARFNPNFPPRNPSGLEADADRRRRSPELAGLRGRRSPATGEPDLQPPGRDHLAGKRGCLRPRAGGARKQRPRNRERTLVNLENGTYFWSVQAVDAGFARSGWSPERRFVVDTPCRRSSAAYRTGRQLVGVGQTDHPGPGVH